MKLNPQKLRRHRERKRKNKRHQRDLKTKQKTTGINRVVPNARDHRSK